VAWVVGDEAILKSEVENVRREMLVNGNRFDGDPYCLIPEQIAVQKLFLHQAKIDSIDVSLSDVSRGVDAQLGRFVSYYGSREKLEEYEGKTYNEIRNELRESMRENQIVSEVQKKIIGDVRLTPSEVRNYYTALPQDSLPFIPTTVEAQIMMMQPVIPLKEIDEVKAKLRDFTERITKGETSFSAMALMWSEDQESAKNGGELGFMGRAQLIPEFANVAFTLTDPNKISNIVETEYGYHIIQLIERRGDRINVRHILLKPKVPQIEVSRVTARMDSIMGDVRNSKFSFEDVVSVLSSDKDTRNNKGLMVNKQMNSTNAGTPRFEMKDLPAEVAVVVDTMKVGEISRPFTMINEQDKQVVAVVKLRHRTDGHRANVSDDYQALKTIVEGKKRSEMLKKWLENKIKTTYVWIHNDWQNCEFNYSGWKK
jgi:peptidyl-prolyl cis-trans isomerase SurA